MFKKYPKIHRLGKEETEGILEGVVHIEEKIDGANVSIWMEDGKICCGSRSQILSRDVDNHEEENTFNGFIKYVREHDGIRLILDENIRLYGEWLVRHTINYKETNYRQFYLFDITTKLPEDFDPEARESFWEKEKVNHLAGIYKINTPFYFGWFTNPSLEEINQYVGKSILGDKGEGVVLKNMEFRDKFGNHNYAKIVTESFKEDNGVVFGGNNKHSDSYWEMYVVNKYMTLARIEKIMNKLQPIIDKKLDLEHIPRISNTAYHDMLTEEIWEIAGKVQSLDFNILKRVAMKKAVQIYKDVLTGDISVADRKN